MQQPFSFPFSLEEAACEKYINVKRAVAYHAGFATALFSHLSQSEFLPTMDTMVTIVY